MTYCLGILTRDGIVAIADTRITSGNDTTIAKKIYSVERDQHTYFIMTSGLRSVRDKVITYFEEVIQHEDTECTRLYHVVNKLGDTVKRVAGEDKHYLAESGLHFNLFAIIGGQLEEDQSTKMYLLYPQGNWIEIGEATPYVIIGNTGFGNPILKRSLTYHSSLEFALKSGYLSFEATRISANDVAYPIDTVIQENQSFQLISHRFEEKDLGHIADFWNSRLREGIDKLPAAALNRAFHKEDPQMSL
ncbi:MAG: peptidase [Bacteroidota bacterium]